MLNSNLLNLFNQLSIINRLVFRFFMFVGIFFTTFASSLPSFASKSRPLLINGAGASFPYILYSKWFNEYRKVDPNVMINYRSIGSGGGIRQFLAGTLDFGASDTPMQKKLLKKHKQTLLHLPTTLSAVVISYNLPLASKTADQTANQTPLRLTANLLARIYTGKIKKWNDPQIKAINPQQTLPDHNIIPVYRSDGSGTTAVFTEYMAEFSKTWLKLVGKGKSVYWPVGVGGKGNEGVMGLIRKLPGSMGYIGLSYAIGGGRHFPTALIQNKSNHFVKANSDTVKYSAEQIWKKHHNVFQPLVTASGKRAYPLASYTYLLVHQKTMSARKGNPLIKFLKWALKDGQAFCKSLHYIPLPQPVVQTILQQVKTIQTTNRLK